MNELPLKHDKRHAFGRRHLHFSYNVMNQLPLSFLTVASAFVDFKMG